MEATKGLSVVLSERAKALPPEIMRRLQCASEIVIFGSYASGLESQSSDLDVFCVGQVKTHFKSPQIEIMILPEYDLYSDLWLGSELANHISNYGVPLGPRPEWFSRAKVAPEAVARKARRITSYVRSLKSHWRELSSTAKSRYELKLRRELQRLQLLQGGQSVPCTPALDTAFPSGSQQDLIMSSSLSTEVKIQLMELLSEKVASQAGPD
jgi:hypothetical protein